MGLTSRQIAIIVLLFFVNVLNYLDRQVLSVLAPVLRKEIGLSQMQYAMAVNSFLGAYAVMYAGSGMVLDRLGARIGLAFFVTAWSLASGLHAAVAGFAGLAAFRFLLGLTEPGGWTGTIKAIAERFNPLQRGLVTGLAISGASVANVITPPLVVFLSLQYGWRMAFLIPSLAGLVWLPLWLRASRTNGAAHAEQIRSSMSLREMLAMIRHKRVFAYMLTRFFGDSSGYFFIFWIPEYLTSVKQFNFAMIGALAWIPYLANDFGPVTGGYLAGKLIQRGVPPLMARKIVMSFAALVVTVGAFSQVTSEVWLVLLSLSISMFGVGLWAGNMHAIPADAFPPDRVATAYGMAGSAGAIGGILFNTLTGYFSARNEYSVIFAVLLLLEPLGVAALWLWMREARQEKYSVPSSVA